MQVTGQYTGLAVVKEFGGAFGTYPVSKLGSSTFTEVVFHRFPVSLVVPKILTPGANGEQAAQRLYFL